MRLICCLLALLKAVARGERATGAGSGGEEKCASRVCGNQGGDACLGLGGVPGGRAERSHCVRGWQRDFVGCWLCIRGRDGFGRGSFRGWSARGFRRAPLLQGGSGWLCGYELLIVLIEGERSCDARMRRERFCNARLCCERGSLAHARAFAAMGVARS